MASKRPPTLRSPDGHIDQLGRRHDFPDDLPRPYVDDVSRTRGMDVRKVPNCLYVHTCSPPKRRKALRPSTVYVRRPMPGGSPDAYTSSLSATKAAPPASASSVHELQLAVSTSMAPAAIEAKRLPVKHLKLQSPALGGDGLANSFVMLKNPLTHSPR